MRKKAETYTLDISLNHLLDELIESDLSLPSLRVKKERRDEFAASENESVRSTRLTRTFSALAGVPRRRSTSAGRYAITTKQVSKRTRMEERSVKLTKYRSSTRTRTLPVCEHFPTSLIVSLSPSQTTVIPTCEKAFSTNSRTGWVSPVARTKSSGSSC